jgi:hypothetical protein
LIELLGSLLAAALSCIILNLIGLLVSGSIFQASIERWAIYTWATLTSIFACWSVLTIGKLWESRQRETMLRRVIMAANGLLVAAVAVVIAGLLNLNLVFFKAGATGTEGFFAIQGIQIIPAYLLFFTLLFGVLRWWRQVDPVRKTRLSLWSVGLCLIWAVIFSQVLHLAPTWNCILAVVISISLQLSATWLHPHKRVDAVPRSSFEETASVSTST